jgi:hypothetical protein
MLQNTGKTIVAINGSECAKNHKKSTKFAAPAHCADEKYILQQGKKKGKMNVAKKREIKKKKNKTSN